MVVCCLSGEQSKGVSDKSLVQISDWGSRQLSAWDSHLDRTPEGEGAPEPAGDTQGKVMLSVTVGGGSAGEALVVAGMSPSRVEGLYVQKHFSGIIKW